jgi:hypothetical protein
MKCPVGTYALRGGFSTGQAGQANNPTCEQCPFGGTCSEGSVLAQPGYWGASTSDNTVAFVMCPSGYCCDDVTSCVSIASGSCAGNREGILCAECALGFVEAIGSTACVHISACREDKPLFWVLFTIGVFVDAFVQLVFVSEVWNPSAVPPDATIKCLIYFYQVRCWCSVVRLPIEYICLSE